MPRQPPPGVTGYQNPLRGLRGLTPERIDMGVDYSGTGPIYALGPGKVVESDTAWAGGVGAVGPGTFIEYQLTGGPLAGYYVYVAENINPNVQVGQTVGPTTVLGQVTGGIETGFGTGQPGQTAAAAAGQQAPGPDPGARPTAYGAAFSDVLKFLGAPGGIEGSAQPFGVIPQTLNDILATMGIAGPPGSGNQFPGSGIIGAIGSLFKGITEVGHFFGVLVAGLSDIHMYISLGWLLLGLILVALGINLWLKIPQKLAKAGGAAAALA